MLQTEMQRLTKLYRRQLIDWLAMEKEEGHVTMEEAAKRIGIHKNTLNLFLYKETELRLKSFAAISKFLRNHYDPLMNDSVDSTGLRDRSL
jgi:hypothetical protein